MNLNCCIYVYLQHDVLADAAVRVDVDALVVVAEQQLHAAGVGQRHDAVRHDRALRLHGNSYHHGI